MTEAFKGLDGDRWKGSMAEELNGLWEQRMFREAIPPQGTVPRETRFVFKIKRPADGSVERYKTRLVAKGYAQRSDVDFSETFCPVVGYDTMRTASAVSSSKGWNMKALDCKQSF